MRGRGFVSILEEGGRGVEFGIEFEVGIVGVKLEVRGLVMKGVRIASLDLGLGYDLDLGRRARPGCRMWRSRGILELSGGIPCAVEEGM